MKKEKYKKASVQLRSLTQAADVALRLGRPLEEIYSIVSRLRVALQALASMVAADAVKDPSLRHSHFLSSSLSFGVAQCLMTHFLQNGILQPFSGTESFTGLLPAEYLIGVMHFTKLVEQYAVGRAIATDAASISVCQQLVEAILEQLLLFDFRNGPLRRNYDGVKYVNQHLQNMALDLSLLPKAHQTEDVVGEQTQSLLDSTDFDKIRSRIAAADLARDNVIKQCRDTQKAAKNAIFAIHRGDHKKANVLINSAAVGNLRIYRDVMGDFKQNRFQGTFPNAMEEWAEAALFSAWIADGKILMLDQLERRLNASLLEGDAVESQVRKSESWVNVRIGEYVGGLVDLTGEIGRWAIAQATVRNQSGVFKVRFVTLLGSMSTFYWSMPSYQQLTL